MYTQFRQCNAQGNCKHYVFVERFALRQTDNIGISICHIIDGRAVIHGKAASAWDPIKCEKYKT